MLVRCDLLACMFVCSQHKFDGECVKPATPAQTWCGSALRPHFMIGQNRSMRKQGHTRSETDDETIHLAMSFGAAST